MKKILLSVLSVVLCLCLIVPIGVTAFAKTEETPIVAESSVTLEEYLADAAAKGNRVQVVNSNANDTLDKCFRFARFNKPQDGFYEAACKGNQPFEQHAHQCDRQGSRFCYSENFRYS